MSYQIIPNILFIFAILGILLIILRHLPEATVEELKAAELPPEQRLTEKGLPVIAISKIRTLFRLWFRKIWNFVLEAKDLKPTSLAGYKIKKIFKSRPPQLNRPAASAALPQSINPVAPVVVEPQPVKDENFYLEAIKDDPKNLANYDSLGKFYLEAENFIDAKDIYEYLAKHEPGDSDFLGRLAYCFYQTKNYEKAAEHYKQSLALDSTQPNRYYNLGLSLQALSKNTDAIKVFLQAIALEPSNPKYYISLSNSYVKKARKQEAKEALEKAKKLDPKNEVVLNKLKVM
jgi:Flp pilus assembly protein TadD